MLVGPDHCHATFLLVSFLESSRSCSLLDRLDALPAAGQLLLPQADLVIAGADGQDVAAQAPARAPGHGVEVEGGLLPVAWDVISNTAGSNSEPWTLPSEGFVLVQILTVLSCEAEAMYALDSTVGDHATSRTQSVWPDSVLVQV